MAKPTDRSLPLLCAKPWTTFRIDDHKGNVKPCCWTKVHFGNINKNSMEEIWNGEPYVRVREMMLRRDVESICDADCPVLVGEYPDAASDCGTAPHAPLYQKNWLLQQEEISSGTTVLKSKPTKVKIVPTVKCNLNCDYCYQDRADSAELPAHIGEIVQDLFPVLDELLVIGGEPLAARECLDIIKAMDQDRYPDLRLALITNATTVSDKIVELLSSRRISWILASVDAASAETYKRLRGGNFSKVIEGVNRLNQIRHQQGHMWSLQLGFVFMRSNMHEALDFVKLARDLKVGFTFQPIFGDWHNESYYHLPHEVERARSILAELDSYLNSIGLAGKNKTQRLRVKLNSISASKAT